MEKPTKTQIELLKLITTKPYGQGLTIKQAARLLHLKYEVARYQLKKFRLAWPDRWQTIQDMKEQAKTQKALDKKLKKNLKRPVQIGALDWADTSNNQIEKVLFDDNDLSLSDNKEISKIAYLKIKERF